MAQKGTHYRDISHEFKIALTNYSIWKRDGAIMRQKDFAPERDPTLVNNVVAGRAKSDDLRGRIVNFTKRWYWNFNQKTPMTDEKTSSGTQEIT